jgi:hypothetical protein
MTGGQPAALAALAAALTAALAADAGLAGPLAGRIHAGPPRPALAPYLAIAEMRALDRGDGEGGLLAATVTLEAVTPDGPADRALDLAARAVAVALAVPPALGGATLVLLRETASRLERGRDGRGWRAVAVLDALLSD